MLVNNEIFAQVKSAVDIADVIGERVKLKKASRGYVGLCPFHQEDTPSFHVYTDTQSYFCFGCNKAGDVYTFLMEYEHIEFREALEILAGYAGIELPKYEKQQGGKTDREILNLTQKFYEDNLRSNVGVVARAYMERRKLDSSDISRFSLGYSLNAWDSLVLYLRQHGISDKQMFDLGLASQGKYGLYDKFRGRLMFPIRNVAGNVIAFGGRLIDGDGAKYLNSSESTVFNKGKNLYLLDRARNSIREKKRVILVEGYMDAIRLHKCGFTETVASLGTSLTVEQAKLLSKYADKCYICYDSDSAGQSATMRGMYILAENGLDVHVINLPEGKDPDEFLSNNSPEKFEQSIKNATPLVLQHINILRPALNDSATRKAAMNELFTSLLRLRTGEVLQYTANLCEITGAPPSKIKEFFWQRQKQLPEASRQSNDEFRNSEKLCEAGLCSLLRHYSECRLMLCRKPMNDLMKLFKNPTAQLVVDALLTSNPEEQVHLWTSIGDLEPIALIARGDEYCARMNEKTAREKLIVIYNVLVRRDIQCRIRGIMAKMQKLQATTEELMELTTLKTRLSQMVSAS